VGICGDLRKWKCEKNLLRFVNYIMVVREFIIFLKCGKYKFIIYNKKFINNELKQHMNNEF